MITVARYGIGILSLLQASAIALVIYLSFGIFSEPLYNLEDLELSSYKTT